jgi:hypothetical protein
MTRIRKGASVLLASSVLTTSGAFDDDVQKQIDEIKSVLPKIAIPMGEVGDRFQNMYFAAKDRNWALAAYTLKSNPGDVPP